MDNNARLLESIDGINEIKTKLEFLICAISQPEQKPVSLDENALTGLYFILRGIVEHLETIQTTVESCTEQAA